MQEFIELFEELSEEQQDLILRIMRVFADDNEKL